MLKELDDTPSEVQRKWLRFMLEKVGSNNLPYLLDYYENIGWISRKVTDRLLELSKNEKCYTASSWKLSPEEHRRSLLFIKKLMGKPVDDTLLLTKTEIPRRYTEAQHLENEKKNFEIQRREVTIKNLEQELEKKNKEIHKLNENIHKLEEQLDKCRTQLKKNQMYRSILKENLRLRKM